LNEDFIEEYYNGMAAVLREVSINSMREGDPGANIPSKAKERRYKKMDLATMPPIVVQNGQIEDGNYPYRVAKQLGAKAIWCYVVVDEGDVPAKPLS